MGSPSSKVRRKKKEDKKHKNWDTLATINKWNEENRNSTNIIEPQKKSNQQSIVISETPKDFDLNTLPRQKTGSEEIIRAIDDVNKRISKSSNTKSPKSTSDDSKPVETSLDIDNLLLEVKRKAKKHEALDKKIEENQKKLSDYYSKLSRTSLENTKSEPRSNLNIYCTTSKGSNQQRKHELAIELKKLEELENEKHAKLLEQDRLLAVQKMKLTDAILVNKTLNKFDSSNKQTSTNKKVNIRNVKELTREPIEDQYHRSDTLIKTIKNLFETEDDEPIYDKPNDLKMVDVRQDANVVEILKKCKKKQDLYNIDPDELKQIIEFIEQKEKDSGNVKECSYYLKDTEIYSTFKNQPKYSTDFNVPKPDGGFKENEDKNTKIARQILDDLVLNYKIEQSTTAQVIPKTAHFNKHTNVKKVDFNPINTVNYIEKSKNSNSISSMASNDPMPNVTKFIEIVEHNNRKI